MPTLGPYGTRSPGEFGLIGYGVPMRYLILAAVLAVGAAAQITDLRHISRGNVIPDEFYADQPYIVKTDDGAWLCVMTTGPGVEGAGGQHVVSLRSSDRGHTWEAPVDVEPANGPEASYAVVLKVPGGRIFVFYNHNTDNVRRVIADDPPYREGFNPRVDSLGHFVFKYSDDHGRSWSANRYDIPQRSFAIDRANPYGGSLKFFWNVGKAFVHQGAGYVPLHKVGGFGEGFFTSSEGVLLRSENILTEPDPSRIRWETLPDGDIGIRAPQGGGPIAEEQSFSILSDGSLFCVFRTIDGHPAYTYSRDGGRTWEPSQYMRYDDGRLMKHPRAASFAWRCENGKFLYWFHNHGGRFIREHPRRRTIAYEERNPVWLSGGIEADSQRGKVIRWSQPEVLLYDDDPIIRMSYPDLIEDAGQYFVTETQKDIARTHTIDPLLLEGLWDQFESVNVPLDALLVSHSTSGPATIEAPALPLFYRRSNRADHGSEDLRAGFTLDCRLQFRTLAPDQVLLDNRTPDGRGFLLTTIANGAVQLVVHDGRSENRWASDPGSLVAGNVQHLAVIVDGGPKLILFVIDGKLNDGGDHRQFGWGRFSPHLRSAQGSPELRIGEPVKGLRIYGRALRTSEAIATYRAGAP
ncbi:MAG: exo-alpha-sialidase [Bryobacterales bacterium]|nr:exo-alpha-sialidase [Bryobacterales bacterium]